MDTTKITKAENFGEENIERVQVSGPPPGSHRPWKLSSYKLEQHGWHCFRALILTKVHPSDWTLGQADSYGILKRSYRVLQSFWFFYSEFFLSISEKKMTSKKPAFNGEAAYLIQDQNDEIYKNYSTINKDKDSFYQRSPSFDPQNRITLSWHNINVYVKPKGRRFSSCRNQYDVNEKKQLLHNVNGEVKPGQLMAIMGASGAGKTTLLNVLTNRNLRLLDVQGEVLINGQSVGESITKLSAYVQQDDLFIGTLTVREHLVFQALLRMDTDLTYAERMTRVDEVILELGLTKCADTRIGVAGRVKGISGGEAKRLAFAAEVLTKPALMFCDEPTSGLDSFMSQSIVSVLKAMAEGGRTIVCTIHQPSSEVFELFDHLFLMAEGRVAFRGRSSRALDFFKRAGYECPINYNPADFFIQNLAIIPGRENESREKVAAIVSQFEKEARTIESSISVNYSIPVPHIKETSRYKASWCSQFRAVLWRSWISLIRDPMLIKVRFLQSLVIGLMLGLVFYKQELNDKGIMNINGALFLILMNSCFGNMFSVINAFTLEQPIFLREHWNGMYRTDIYFLCKTIAEAPVLIFMTAVLICIVYWMAGFNKDFTAFLICLAIMILVSNTAASFGYMISCISGSLNVALSLGTPLIMPLVLFGGFYLNAAISKLYNLWPESSVNEPVEVAAVLVEYQHAKLGEEACLNMFIIVKVPRAFIPC
ncbi:protein white [Trichonephila clavata]|uniref:Protein white n=1 Tax=Trichonephila clavata TaxID=2740835 RepID=A0A8X6L6P8_TRICU|nr:protein white [Trichonephila clavata]